MKLQKEKDTQDFQITFGFNLKKNKLMTTEEAKKVLRDNGFFVDSLWHVNDVKNISDCDDETAQTVLYWTLTSPTTTEYINDSLASFIRLNNIS